VRDGARGKGINPGSLLREKAGKLDGSTNSDGSGEMAGSATPKGSGVTPRMNGQRFAQIGGASCA
jgi:hypothetical protein